MNRREFLQLAGVSAVRCLNSLGLRVFSRTGPLGHPLQLPIWLATRRAFHCASLQLNLNFHQIK